MMLEHGGQNPCRWAAVVSFCYKVRCSAHSLNDWLKTAGFDGGRRAGVPSEVADKPNILGEQNNLELQQDIDVPRNASACFT